MENTNKPMRVFSGIQPSGRLTIANYLGALKHFVGLQQAGTECIYCIVDLHALTVWQDPKELRQSTRLAAACFIASGIDVSKSVLFNQSHVAAHAELAWIFNCVARLGWLGRMTQFKEKAGANRENSSVGLFVYPTLMAADILAYHATHVPVGDDQKQHLELTRDIAIKFNNDFDVDFFPVIEPIIGGVATRIMSLRDGTRKMSKSDPSDMSRINLTDDADAIARKIRKAKTDSQPLPESSTTLEERPEARNLINLYAAMSDTSVDAVINQYGGKMFSEFKPALAELAVECIAPIARKVNALMRDSHELDRILQDGGMKAASIAKPIVRKTYDIVGLLNERK